MNQIPVVKKSKLYGSLTTNSHDELSDIDIEIDVSGYDNGKFMIELNEFIESRKRKFE